MTTITDYRTYELRFPTSLNADGSDAMNKDGDHSAAYVMLLTDDPDLMGNIIHKILQKHFFLPFFGSSLRR